MFKYDEIRFLNGFPLHERHGRKSLKYLRTKQSKKFLSLIGLWIIFKVSRRWNEHLPPREEADVFLSRIQATNVKVIKFLTTLLPKDLPPKHIYILPTARVTRETSECRTAEGSWNISFIFVRIAFHTNRYFLLCKSIG